MWLRVVPVLGILAAVGWPVAKHVEATRAEAAAVTFLAAVHDAQLAFRQGPGHGGFATTMSSLLTPCANASTDIETGLHELPAAYDVQLRAARGAADGRADCHGRPTAVDYYVALQPGSFASPGQKAYASASDGRVFLFYDGVAPLEVDMAAGGLATPLDMVDAFKIP